MRVSGLVAACTLGSVLLASLAFAAPAEPPYASPAVSASSPTPCTATPPRATASPAPSPSLVLPWRAPVILEKPVRSGDTVLLGQDGSLQVTDCLDYARANHPRLRAAQARYEQALGQLHVSDALYVPTAQVQVTRSHTYAQNGGVVGPTSPATSITLPGGTTLNLPSSVVNPTTILLNPAATLTYLLDDGGLRRNSVRRDRQNLITYALDWRNEWRKLSVQIELDYLAVALQRTLVVVQEDSLRMAEATLKQAEGLFRAGKKTRLDVLQAETDVQGARATLYRQIGNTARAWMTLEVDISAPVNHFARLEPLLTSDLVLPAPPKFQEMAFTQRSDVLSYANQIAVQRYQILVNKAALNPTWQTVLSYGYLGGDFPLLTTWKGALTLTIPLTQGPTVRGQNEQVQGKIVELLSSTYDLRLTITGDLSRNFLLREEARQRIRVLQSQMQDAEQAYKLAERRYMGGISQYIEMTNARQVLNSARTDLANAYDDARQAEIQLLGAMEEAFPKFVRLNPVPWEVPAPSSSESPVAAPAASPAPSDASPRPAPKGGIR